MESWPPNLTVLEVYGRMATPRIKKLTIAEMYVHDHYRVWANYFAKVVARKVRKHGKECECSLCEALNHWYESY